MAAADQTAASAHNPSYLANKGDDLGRPIVLHKPLNKGEHAQAGLSKVFDDPGMRPRAHARELHNKPHSALQTSDIWGAQAKPTPKARGTNPAVPMYQLPSAEPMVQMSSPTTTRPWSARTSQERGPSQETLAAAAQARPARDFNNISDIEGTRPKAACRPLSAQPLSTSTLNASDIEGARPGWKPHHRAHVGVNLRDPGLDVSDINSYHLPKSHRTLFKGQQSPEQQQAARASAAQQQQAQQQTERAQLQAQQQAQRPDLPSGFHYTGLPVFQTPPPSSQAWALHAAGEPVSAVDADLMQIAGEQQAQLSQFNAELQAARQAQRTSHSAVAGHTARVAMAEQREAARQATNATLSQMCVSRDAVEKLWGACRASDRQRSGRVTIAELGRALEVAGLPHGADQMKALVTGLQDNAGLLPYCDLAKVLLVKSMQPGSNPQLFPTSGSRAARPSSARPATASHDPAKARSSRPVSARPAAALSGPPTAAQMNASPAPEPAYTAPAPAAFTPTAAAVPQAGCLQQPETISRYGQQGPSVTWSAPPAAPVLSPVQASAPAETSSLSVQQQQQQQQQQQATPPAAEQPSTKFFAYKANPFWFSGVEAPETLQQEAAAWKARGDPTHAVTAYHVGEGILAAAAPPETVPSSSATAGPSPVTQPVAGIRDSPTTSSLLKSGQLSGGELAEQLKAKHATRPASAPRGRPSQQQLYPAPASGASFANTLKGTLVPVGTGSLNFGLPSRPAAGMPSRPVSARPAGGRAEACFSAVAQSKGGPTMEKLHTQMLRSDIAAVRMLF